MRGDPIRFQLVLRCPGVHVNALFVKVKGGRDKEPVRASRFHPRLSQPSSCRTKPGTMGRRKVSRFRGSASCTAVPSRGTSEREPEVHLDRAQVGCVHAGKWRLGPGLTAVPAPGPTLRVLSSGFGLQTCFYLFFKYFFERTFSCCGRASSGRTGCRPAEMPLGIWT